MCICLHLLHRPQHIYALSMHYSGKIHVYEVLRVSSKLIDCAVLSLHSAMRSLRTEPTYTAATYETTAGRHLQADVFRRWGRCSQHTMHMLSVRLSVCLSVTLLYLCRRYVTRICDEHNMDCKLSRWRSSRIPGRN